MISTLVFPFIDDVKYANNHFMAFSLYFINILPLKSQTFGISFLSYIFIQMKNCDWKEAERVRSYPRQ